MSDNSVCYLLFFGWINLEWFGNFMNHNFTSVLWLGILIQNLDDVKFFFTASKLVIRTKRSMKRHLNFRLLLMHMTISHLCNMIIDVTSLTPEYVQVRPNLPIDLTPWNSVSFSNESYKFLKIPSSINDVFCSNLSVIVDVWFSFVTVKNCPLIHCK